MPLDWAPILTVFELPAATATTAPSPAVIPVLSLAIGGDAPPPLDRAMLVSGHRGAIFREVLGIIFPNVVFSGGDFLSRGAIFLRFYFWRGA